MKFCPQCGAQMDDAATFCPNCGAASASQQNAGYAQQPYGQPPYAAPVLTVDPYDHTAEFDAQDISDNKVLCMLVYLMGAIGIIYALLAGKDSKYVAFHVRQALKFSVVTILLGLVAAILCWTIIVPIAVGICIVIIFVLKIICFFQICSGKAKEPAIIRSLGFLR